MVFIQQQRQLTTLLGTTVRIRRLQLHNSKQRLYSCPKLSLSSLSRQITYQPHKYPKTKCTLRDYHHTAICGSSVTDKILKQDESVGKGNVRQEMDFFDEPISFIFKTQEDSTGIVTTEESLISFDGFILQYVTRGRASNDGGDEFGLSAKASHSTAIPWTDILKHLAAWCYIEEGELKCKAPMFACAALSPILALGGSSYLRLIDESYAQTMRPSFTAMAKAAVLCLNDDSHHLTIREKYHLSALKFLLDDEHSKALSSLRDLLVMCPGDALGLALAMDVASSTGDRQSAFQAATSVASYWSERGHRSAIGETAIPGHALGSSLIALGLAVGGRYHEAEQLTNAALKRDFGGSSGICAWAMTHIYDCEGRVSEGTSLLTGFGTEYYEPCGFMFFDTILAGAGARYVLDRDGANADTIVFRLYDQYFGRILEYSGYTELDKAPILRTVPQSRRKMLADSATGAASAVFGRIFGQSNELASTKEKDQDENPKSNSIDESTKKVTLEDIFTWLPPTPHLLTEATFLLTRLTISGAITAHDDRWSHLSVAWEKVVNVEKKYCNDKQVFHQFPLCRVASSLVLGDEHLKNEAGDETGHIERAAAFLGSLMKLNKKYIKKDKIGWKTVALDLSDARKQKQFGWDQSLGNFLEHSICHAAIKSDDYEMLCLARSICSESIVLRANSPETWFRYGVVLEKLGDNEGAKNAFQASVSLGSGEGGRISPT